MNKTMDKTMDKTGAQKRINKHEVAIGQNPGT